MNPEVRTARRPGGQRVGTGDLAWGCSGAVGATGLLRPETGRGPAREELSPAARRGKGLFEDPKVGCAACHPGPLFTDLKAHAVGTANRQDRPGQRFDTPTLVECWRTAPYLHDGSVVTIREVLTTGNRGDQHGRTSGLTADQLDDLAAYVLSL